ncbi:MAG: GNAT family N-acetyltransferase [Limisphaerales bacterium]
MIHPDQFAGRCRLSTDPSRLKPDVIHAWLSRESYWAAGIPRETVARALAGSLCAGVYAEDGAQVAFARVITDRATFGWLADVFVLPAHQGAGLGKALVAYLLAHPDLQDLRRMMLATADAHGLYARFGFTTLEKPERFMERHQAMPYKAAA